MIELIIEGVPPYDGRYETPDFAFTNRELHRIKQISEVRAGELLEALEANDRAAFVGLATVVLERGGIVVDPNRLWDTESGAIRLQVGDDADPPTPDASGNDPTASPDTSGVASSEGGG